MKPFKLLPFAALLVLGCSEKTPEVAKAPEPSPGEQIFTKNCRVCHAQGINGAPILGNQSMWAERKTQGLDTLVQHASEGYGLMPAKGGNTDLSKEEITLAIQYMLSKL